MIVWGSDGPSPFWINSGGLYDPQTDTWSGISLANAPHPRSGHLLTWTGDRVVVTGGRGWTLSGPHTVLSTLIPGGAYDPASDTWGPGPAFHRTGHVALWTGTRLLLWGGVCILGRFDPNFDPCRDLESPPHIGKVVDLATGTSTNTTALNAPSAPQLIRAVWSGMEMLVWGGSFGGGAGVTAAGRYDPATDVWSPISATGAPSPRTGHTAVWTGLEMVVWGGVSGPAFTSTPTLETGGRYNPFTDTWNSTSTVDAASSRTRHTAIWTGAEMIVFGGYNSQTNTVLDTGGRYRVAAVGTDDDSDGIPLCAGDCDDSNPAVYPGAAQVCGDGLNNDCQDAGYPGLSGTNEGDDDGDGFTECLGDCADGNPTIHPGQIDLPGNTVDEDCDGVLSCDPAGAWSSHGEFIQCVVQTCNELVAAGSLSHQECGELISGISRRRAE